MAEITNERSQLMRGVFSACFLRTALPGLLIALGCGYSDPPELGAVASSISVGVISPGPGSRSANIGEAHEETVVFALETLGKRLDGSNFKLEPIYVDDKANATLSELLAWRLSLCDEVVAIIGPVNSESTASVLSALDRADLQIPVISALSTSPSLAADPGRHNFFRTIFNDSHRMRQYGRYLQERRAEYSDGFLLLYEDDSYGQGLRKALESHLPHPERNRELAWCHLEGNCGGEDELPNNFTPPKNCDEARKLLANYTEEEGGRKDVCQLARQPEDVLCGQERDDCLHRKNVLLLGSSTRSLCFSQKLREGGDREDVKFLFVGDVLRFAGSVPEGSVTIGDPLLDPAHADNAALRVRWRRLLDTFERDFHLDRRDFQPTTYDAVAVLRTALSQVLTSSVVRPPIDDLRHSLIEELKEATFESIEPWRKIDFSNGELEGKKPVAPIFLIDREPDRADHPDPKGWFTLDVPRHRQWLSGPIRVRVKAHGFVEPLTEILVDDEPKALDSGNEPAEARLYLWSPRERTIRVPAEKLEASIKLTFPWNYLLASVAGALAALLYLYDQWTTFSFWQRVVRVVTGTLTALVLTFASFYLVGTFPEFPLPPSFGEVQWVNALALGLLGGWMGPWLLRDIVGSLVQAVIPRGGRAPSPRSENKPGSNQQSP